MSGRRRPTLAVWKFASCDGCQLSLLDCEDELLALAGEVEIALLPRGDARDGRGARTTSRSSRARSRPRTTRSGSRRCAAPRGAGHDRRLRHRRRHPGAAQLRRRRRVRRARLRLARLHLDARHLDADLRARAGRLRAARLPDQQAPAARGAHRFLHGRRPNIPDHERLHGVQAARHRLRDGRARHAVPRPGHPRRLRRALPVVQPRLLRLLRPDGDAEHGVARRPAARARHGRARRRARLPHLQRRAVPRRRVEHGRAAHERSRPTTSPGSRARAR